MRLKSYWNKICEDEKRSQLRNDQLLKDFDRVEAHVAELHARTDKLRDMKVCTCIIPFILRQMFLSIDP